MLKDLDFIGGRIDLYYEQNNYLKSSLGGVITIFTVMLLGLLLFGFGRSFFERANPNFIPKTISPSEYPIYTINNKIFTFAFKLEDDDGVLFNNTSFFYVVFNYWEYVKDDNGLWEKTNEEILKIQDCTAELFSDEEKFNKKQLNTCLCPKFNNLKIRGSWDSNYVSFFQIETFRCLEGDDNPFTKEKCVSNQETKSLLDRRLYFSTILQTVLVNPEEYNNPLEFDYITKYKMMFQGFMKSDILFFQTFEVESDFGWMIKLSHYHRMFGISEETSDFFILKKETINFLKP